MPKKQIKKKKKAAKKVKEAQPKKSDKSLPTTGITIDYINKRVDDANENYEENYKDKVEYGENMYHNIKSRSEDMEEWQSNLGMNMGFGLCNQEIPIIMNGLFPKGDFYHLSPTSLKKGQINLEASAKGMQSIMEKQSEEMGLYRTFYTSVLDSLKSPMGIFKLTWKFEVEQHNYLDVEDGKVKEAENQYKISRPQVCNISINQFFWDREAETREQLRYAGEFGRLRVGDVRNDTITYNGKDVDKFLEWAKENELEDDDFTDTVEYWEPSRVAITAENKFVIKDHYTYMKNNHIPYYFFVKFPDPREITGVSTIEAIADNVEYIDFIVNQQADNVKLMNNKMFTMKSSSDIDSKTLRSRPGAIFTVNNTEELNEVQMTPLPVSVYSEIEQHNRFIAGVVGALDPNITDDSQKTATEARIDATTKIMKQKEYITYNREEVKIFLRDWLELDQQFLTKDDAVQMLGEEMASNLRLETDEVDLNTALEIRITGDPGMIDRATAMQDINELAQAIATVSQLSQFIDVPATIEFLVSKFPDLPKDIVVQTVETAAQEGEVPPEDTEQRGQAIVDEIKTTAEARGITPKALLEQLAEKLGTDVQTLMQEINRAGSLKKFLETVKQSQEGSGA